MEAETLKATIRHIFPELADASFTVLTAGWDCIALDADDRLIFKFPRHAEAEQALRAEAALLAAVRPQVDMPVPKTELHPGPPVFSRHDKLPGAHLLPRQYALLPEKARQRLAADMALFYAQLHRLEPEMMAAAGAHPIKPWLPPEDILRRALPALPPELHAYAQRAIAEWQDLPPDPYGTVYGFFDGHGWNMAFDHPAQRLNGIYDFADSGFGALHQEFIYSNWISPDLTARIITGYEILTGLALDRRRIMLLSGILRLSELAEYADDPEHRPSMAQNVADWAAQGAEP